MDQNKKKIWNNKQTSFSTEIKLTCGKNSASSVNPIDLLQEVCRCIPCGVNATGACVLDDACSRLNGTTIEDDPW
jgi:hypothetical protein